MNNNTNNNNHYNKSPIRQKQSVVVSGTGTGSIKKNLLPPTRQFLRGNTKIVLSPHKDLFGNITTKVPQLNLDAKPHKSKKNLGTIKHSNTKKYTISGSASKGLGIGSTANDHINNVNNANNHNFHNANSIILDFDRLKQNLFNKEGLTGGIPEKKNKYFNFQNKPIEEEKNNNNKLLIKNKKIFELLNIIKNNESCTMPINIKKITPNGYFDIEVIFKNITLIDEINKSNNNSNIVSNTIIIQNSLFNVDNDNDEDEVVNTKFTMMFDLKLNKSNIIYT